MIHAPLPGMLPAFRPPMRLLPMLLALALLGACGDDPATISGTLDPDLEASQVWILGGPEGSAVTDGGFLLEDVTGDTVDLRFADGDGERGRMRIHGVRPGARIELERIWEEEERLYPARVRLDGVDLIEINGIRYGNAGEPGEEVETSGRVLAVTSSGDAILLRPVDTALPDLRVVVTPGSRVVSPDGEPIEADRLERGDSIGVRATREGGFLVATELVLPRESAARERGAGEVDETPSRTAAAPAAGSAAVAAREERSRDGADDQGKGRGKGKGKGKKGKS